MAWPVAPLILEYPGLSERGRVPSYGKNRGIHLVRASNYGSFNHGRLDHAGCRDGSYPRDGSDSTGTVGSRSQSRKPVARRSGEAVRHPLGNGQRPREPSSKSSAPRARRRLQHPHVRAPRHHRRQRRARHLVRHRPSAARIAHARGSIQLPDGFAEISAPRYRLRGHQLGYRPKTNSYDAWTVPVFEQYIRDLAVFGTNAIELIPPRSDDAADSPHFPLPPMRMMIEMSRLLDEYGLDVWIWYPAMDRDYSDPGPSNSRCANGARSSASCRASMPSSCPAAIPATPRPNT